MAWTVRRSYWFISFFGFACNYMIRVNLNIAITAMVNIKPTNETIVSECIAVSLAENKTGGGSALSFLMEDADPIMNFMQSSDENIFFKQDGRTFDWDSHMQNFVLGSFFWLHWSTQIPGGILARTLGTKMVFGLSNLFMFLISFAIPTAAYWDYRAVGLLRIIQGLVGGLAWPSMHNLVAHWIPPNERSQFITSYLGSSFGVAVSYPLCGFVIDLLGWESAFYITGGLGVLWYVVWLYVVYDTPDQHPRISEEEKHYIREQLGSSVSSKKLPVPWGAILTSIPVWSTMLVQWGVGWGLHTLMTQGPSYLKYVFGWKPSRAGVWLGVPHLVRTICAVIFSWGADKLLTKKYMTTTGVRKTFIFVGAVLHGLLLLGVGYSNCDVVLAILFLTLSTATTGASAAGVLSIMIDLAPNFASVLQGVSGMLGVIPGFISPMVVAYFTHNNETMEQWRNVFTVSAIVISLPGFLYMFIGTAKIQPWNDSSAANITDDNSNNVHNGTTGSFNKGVILENEKIKTTKF